MPRSTGRVLRRRSSGSRQSNKPRSKPIGPGARSQRGGTDGRYTKSRMVRLNRTNDREEVELRLFFPARGRSRLDVSPWSAVQASNRRRGGPHGGAKSCSSSREDALEERTDGRRATTSSSGIQASV